MPEMPALPLGAPVVGARVTGSPNRASLRGPGVGRQQTRLQPVFNRLTQAFEAERLAVADDPAALEPEQVLVLEFAGELTDFMRAVEKIEGLEFLAEQLEDKVNSDEEFTVVDREGRPRPYKRQLFLIASDHWAW